MSEAKTTDTTKALTDAEKKAFATHCRTITNHEKSKFKAGEALDYISDGMLYRETHKTFEAFVLDKFDMGRHLAYRLIHASRTVRILSEAGFTELPTVESQCRPFSGLILDAEKPENDVDKLIELWESILAAKKERKAKKVTAALINDVLNPKKKTEDKKDTKDDKESATGEEGESTTEETTGKGEAGSKSARELELEAELRAVKLKLEMKTKQLDTANDMIRAMKKGNRNKFEGSPLWREFMTAGYKAMSKKHHPDKPEGDEATMKRVNDLWTELQKTL